MMCEVMPFILCGGAGTRLWPLSREAFPKQFHRLTGPSSLFQQTCRRLTGDLFGDLSILSNYQHRFLIQEQLQEIGVTSANIVLEPFGRNTAPAACIAALIAGRDEFRNFGAARSLRSRHRRRRCLRRDSESRGGGRATGIPGHLRCEA